MAKQKQARHEQETNPDNEHDLSVLSQRQKEEERSDIKIKTYHVGVVVQKLLLPSSSGFDYVRIDKIVCCQADASYTIFHLDDNKRLMVSRSLKEFEDLLCPYNFLRVHKSYLINLGRVSGFTKEDGGFVVMDNGKKIAVSRRKKDDFISVFYRS